VRGCREGDVAVIDMGPQVIEQLPVYFQSVYRPLLRLWCSHWMLLALYCTDHSYACDARTECCSLYTVQTTRPLVMLALNVARSILYRPLVRLWCSHRMLLALYCTDHSYACDARTDCCSLCTVQTTRTLVMLVLNVARSVLYRPLVRLWC